MNRFFGAWMVYIVSTFCTTAGGIYYMHVHGHGTPADPARKLKPAQDLIGTSGAGPATTGTAR